MFAQKNKIVDVFECPPLLNFLRFYFHYAYVLCLSPFRIVWDKKTGQSTVQEWFPQKIFCAAAHLISITILIRDLQSNLTQSSAVFFRNPVKYFQLIDSIFNFVYKFTLIKRLWFNRQEFLKVVDYIGTKKILHETKTRLQHPICIHFILGFYSLVALASLIAGKNFLSGLKEWSVLYWIRRLVTYTRYIFFIDSGNKLRKGALEISEITPWEFCLAGVMTFGLLTRFLLGFFIDLIILLVSLTLWSATKSFADSIRFNPYEQWLEGYGTQPKCIFTNTMAKSIAQVKPTMEYKYKLEGSDKILVQSRWAEVYGSFQTVRVLACLINNALGSLVAWFVLEALMYYSVNMDGFLITKDYFKRAYLLAYYLGTIAIFTFSSEVCIQLEEIKTWISEDDNRLLVPNVDLELVLHEMVAKDIGIRGWGVFTITYPMFASIIGTILTFFIICLQHE